MSFKPRLIDIARKANVSLGTVDRVVNGRGKVASKTEKLILEIIQEFDYQPNLMASSLSSKKKTKFAVLVPKPQGEDYWHKIYCGIETAEKVVREFGVKVSKFLYDQDDDIQFTNLAFQILEARFDGVLLAPLLFREANLFLINLEKENIPFVFIDALIKDTHPLCSISQDNFQSGVLAAKLLDYGIEKGEEVLSISHRKQNDNIEIIAERSNGFKYFFETLTFDKRVVHSLEIVSANYERFAALLHEKLIQLPNIKGIFIHNSKAHWVARYLHENNRSAIKLIGFDLIEQNIKYLHNGIIDFILFDSVEKQGELGLKILFDHIIKREKTTSMINMPIHIVAKENLEGFCPELNFHEKVNNQLSKV